MRNKRKGWTTWDDYNRRQTFHVCLNYEAEISACPSAFSKLICFRFRHAITNLSNFKRYIWHRSVVKQFSLKRTQMCCFTHHYIRHFLNFFHNKNKKKKILMRRKFPYSHCVCSLSPSLVLNFELYVDIVIIVLN